MTGAGIEVDLESGSKDAASSVAPKVTRETVKKPNQNTKVGLGIINKFGLPVIGSIHADGLCAGTSLAPGMCVYSINGAVCKNPDSAVAMLQVTEGSITIVAGPIGLVEATVTKPSKDTKVGLHLTRLRNNSAISIAEITALFNGTDLKEGMHVLEVNNVDCSDRSLEEILKIISDAEKSVSVLAYDANHHQMEKIKGHNPPQGLSHGEWGTTSFVGPLTAGLAVASIYTIIGPLLILLFFPCDQADVYRINGKLYSPSGEFYKTATSKNFEVCKSEHVTKAVRGQWGSTTYVGPLTVGISIVAAPTVLGAILILLFFPLDKRDILYKNGNLYKANGDFYKTATKHNFSITDSAHL